MIKRIEDGFLKKWAAYKKKIRKLEKKCKKGSQ